MDILLNPEIWVALLTLTALEIVLGIDNIVFISILANKLPEDSATTPAAWASSPRWACASCCCWASAGW